VSDELAMEATMYGLIILFISVPMVRGYFCIGN